jgi:TonB family protein
MGIQQDPQFLLYYQTVQDRIKKAWNYVGGNGDLTTSVQFAIGPDGNLTGVKVTQSSQDPAFDESVMRAIRHAAPFPPPPEKYRSDFGEGVDADFKLGELKS